jgi:pimeloyl-ACP methyl ester carboxylesterase
MIGAAVDQPALVVSGEVDATCPAAAGAAMAAVLRAEHLVLPGRGHVVSLEDPAGLAELIQAFIAARGGAL